jgi:hypothetical protein
MMYVIRSALVAVKKEMDEKGLTFDEFLEHYDEAIAIMENSCRA